MNRTLSKAVVSTMLAVGSVKTADVAKDTFTLKVGAKTYTVDFTAKTKWTKGTSKDLKAGASATVTGTLAGTVLKATSIKA